MHTQFMKPISFESLDEFCRECLLKEMCLTNALSFNSWKKIIWERCIHKANLILEQRLEFPIDIYCIFICWNSSYSGKRARVSCECTHVRRVPHQSRHISRAHAVDLSFLWTCAFSTSLSLTHLPSLPPPSCPSELLICVQYHSHLLELINSLTN